MPTISYNSLRFQGIVADRLIADGGMRANRNSGILVRQKHIL